METTLIQIISTLAILIPLAFTVTTLRTARITFWLFFVFLIAGLSNDLLGWYSYYINYKQKLNNNALENLRLLASIIYSLIEATFFSWLVSEHPYFRNFRNLRTMIFVMIGAAGVYLIGWKELAVEGNVSHSSLFDATYQIIVSFAAGFILLRFAENESDMTKQPLFWIFIGIFFYCFSTFFIFVIKLLVAEQIANQLWLVHNAANIITYIFYCLGFARAHRTTVQTL